MSIEVAGRTVSLAALQRRLSGMPRSTRQHAAAVKDALAPSSPRIDLHCPEYVEPAADDRDLVERIWRSFKKMKADQPTTSDLYRPSALWQAQLDEAYHPLRQALADDDMTPVQYFLRNFGTWKSYLGVESSTLMRRHMRTALGRAWLRRELFAQPLRQWRCIQGERDLERLSYPQHGNQVGAFVDGRFVGPGSFVNDIHGAGVGRLVAGSRRPLIAELGAGYGKLAYFVLRDVESFAYVDFDLPETLTLAAFWLIKAFPGCTSLLYGEAEYSAEAASRYDLVFMPAWLMGHVSQPTFDVFLNKNSLGEMEQAAAQNYIGHMAAATRGYIFHLNHDVRRAIFPDGREGLLAREYAIPPEDFVLESRYADLGSIMSSGASDDALDIFAYLYRRRGYV